MNDKDKRPVDLIGPVLLIGIGAVVLLNNLGLLDWSFWDVLRLWPVLLVAAGLEIVIGRRSLLGSVISAVLVLGLIFGAIWLGGASGGSISTGNYETLAFPLGNTTETVVKINTGVADVDVGSMSNTINLVEGEVYPGRRADLTTYHNDGVYGEVTLTANSPANGWVGNNSGGRWDIDINDGVEVKLYVDQGVGDIDLDLRGMDIDKVNVDTGIGSVEITVPAKGNYDVNVDGGIGDITIEVPAGIAVEVYTDSGLVSRNMPDDWSRNGDTWRSDDVRGADNMARININLGIGSITVREIGE